MEQIFKYPRTLHLEGSRLQPGDEDLDSVPFKAIAGEYVVVEEKVDGANAAISFDKNGQMRLQSRGHYLTGGTREKHFNLFKQWAYSHQEPFWEVLGARYIVYGEWLYAKHTVFYNYLPHYFLEYDVLDLQEAQFLSTKSRQKLLANLPLVSVPILHEGSLKSHQELTKLLRESNYIKPGHLEQLRQISTDKSLDVDLTLKQTDLHSLMEGLYIKVEEGAIVKARYKYVRASFLTTVLQSESHWLTRPLIPNLLRPDINIFEV